MQDLAHSEHRFDGDDEGAGGEQEAGELARPGRQVHGDGSGPQLQALHQPGDRVRRVGRPGTLVDHGLLAEAEPRHVVDHVAKCVSGAAERL